MANASRWSLSSRQGFLVCGLVTVGLFVLPCGAGMGNVPVAVLGVVIGLLGPAVVVLSSVRANRPDVYGTAHVSQSSAPPPTGLTGPADLHLLVNAHGVHNVVVRVRDANVPVSKWPDIGATLPVLIPNSNPRRLRVLWDQVPAHHDLAVDDPSYSPYVEEEYVDEGADYEGYPLDTALDTAVPSDLPPENAGERDPFVDDTPTAVMQPVAAGQPAAASQPASVAQPAAASQPAGGARRRPSPRPRPEATPFEAAPFEAAPSVAPFEAAPFEAAPFEAVPPESVEAVVPKESVVFPAPGRPPVTPAVAPDPVPPVDGVPPVDEVPSPDLPPADEVSLGDAVDDAEPGVVETKPAAPAAVEPAGPVIPAGGLFVGDSEFVGNSEPPAADAAAPSGTALPPSETATPPGTATPAGPTAAPRDPYVAPYLADGPEDDQQGLGGVHNVGVTVIVSDLGRSLTFYRDLLGLTEIDGGRGSAILASGNARILLRQVADTPPVDRRVVHLNLEVDDVHEAYERLRRHGIEFMHPPRVVNRGEQLEQWAATLRDPDGHAIALTHWEDRA